MIKHHESHDDPLGRGAVQAAHRRITGREATCGDRCHGVGNGLECRDAGQEQGCGAGDGQDGIGDGRCTGNLRRTWQCLVGLLRTFHAESCMPPTCSRGRTAIAVTMIPTPPSHCRIARQIRIPGGDRSSPSDHCRSRGCQAGHGLEEGVCIGKLQFADQERQSRECRQHNPDAGGQDEGLADRQLDTTPEGRGHGQAAHEYRDRRRCEKRLIVRISPGDIDNRRISMVNPSIVTSTPLIR